MSFWSGIWTLASVSVVACGVRDLARAGTQFDLESSEVNDNNRAHIQL